ncbi:MAG TPA: GNAT family N-acetyltransferase [Dokdonella sp.]|uniref:GNAT family N-acetyltransferase n=1 Tax=Dokdonella sp. TaxID=2291710 RepID=UPI002D7EC37D|nr:GNAT family N-acetyltransferase [Dokdonella sp.]HET9033986.1 GNAT family N-acetyltransferase [Dokdonella sp.]
MINTDFTVEPATWSVDLADLRAVRNEVFVVEQEVPEEDEWDELDAQSQHVLARDPDGRPIGTGRLTPHGKIGRMAVLSDWRGRGVGKAILRVLLEQARARHFEQIEIHAQSHATAFYERAGFTAYGEEFDECGIMHRHMRISLAAIEKPERTLPSANESNLLTSSDRESARAATLAVLESARREVCIFTRDLDPDLLDHSDILEAIKQVAISGPHVQIRILVMESERARVETPRLIALAQRLSSVISLRTPVETIDRRYAGSFLVNDRSAWFERPLASRFEGEGSTYAPGRTAQFQETFNEIWERSEDYVEMRRLEI